MIINNYLCGGSKLPGESKKRPAFERLLLHECISNNILQYLACLFVCFVFNLF